MRSGKGNVIDKITNYQACIKLIWLLNQGNVSNAGSDPSLVRESILRSSSSSENRRNSDVAANGSSGRAKASSASVGNGNSNGHVVTFADAAAENGTHSTATATIYAPSPPQPPPPVATHSSPKSGRRNPLRMLSNAIDFRGKRRGGSGGGLRHRTSSAEDAEMRIAAAAIVSQGRERERESSSISIAFSYFKRHSHCGSFMNIHKMLFSLHVRVVIWTSQIR